MIESGPQFNNDSEKFPNTYIEKEVASLLQNINEIQEIKRLRITGEGNELSLTGSFLAKVKIGGLIPVKINIDISAQIENSDGSIKIKDGYSITADKGQDKVRAKIEPHLSKLPVEIKNFIEREQRKKVEKVWIEDGKLHVQYPQTLEKKEETQEELEEKFAPKPLPAETPAVEKPRKSAQERKEELAKKIALDETAEEIPFEEVIETETEQSPDTSLGLLEVATTAKNYISKYFETGIIYPTINDAGDIVLTTSFKDGDKNETLTITLKNTEDQKTLETVAETKGLADVHVDTVGQGIQQALEKEKGKKIEKIWIEDGSIDVIYSDEDIETYEFTAESPDNEPAVETVETDTKIESSEDFDPSFINELIESKNLKDNNGIDRSLARIQRFTNSDNIEYKIEVTTPGSLLPEEKNLVTLKIENNTDKKQLFVKTETDHGPLNDLFNGFQSEITKKLAEDAGKSIEDIWIEGGRIHVIYSEESIDTLNNESPIEATETTTTENTPSTPPETIKINPESILSPNAQKRIAEHMKLLNEKFAEKK